MQWQTGISAVVYGGLRIGKGAALGELADVQLSRIKLNMIHVTEIGGNKDTMQLLFHSSSPSYRV
jgi:hypothetical protein